MFEAQIKLFAWLFLDSVPHCPAKVCFTVSTSTFLKTQRLSVIFVTSKPIKVILIPVFIYKGTF